MSLTLRAAQALLIHPRSPCNSILGVHVSWDTPQATSPSLASCHLVEQGLWLPPEGAVGGSVSALQGLLSNHSPSVMLQHLLTSTLTWQQPLNQHTPFTGEDSPSFFSIHAEGPQAQWSCILPLDLLWVQISVSPGQLLQYPVAWHHHC